MLTEFEKIIAAFIADNELFSPDEAILLAVSGGADSIALVHVLHRLRSEGILKNHFVCAHINHQLRASDSDGDQDFVIEHVNLLDIPVTTMRVDVKTFAAKNKLSTETAARELRIKTLLDIARDENCTKIATGHHKNDNAETLIQRLARGTGFRGLAGIWPARFLAPGFTFTSPLLCVTRAEIVEYLNERNIKWRTDHTNADCQYRRNFIRHHLIPTLQSESTDSLTEQLFSLSNSARRLQQLISKEADNVWPSLSKSSDTIVNLDAALLAFQPQPVKVELLRRALTTIGCGEQQLTAAHYDQLSRLAEHKTGDKKIELPNRFQAVLEYGTLIFSRSSPSQSTLDQDDFLIPQIPGQNRFGDYLVEASVFDSHIGTEGRFEAGKTAFVEWFDLDRLKLPLKVGFRQSGEKFVPFGHNEPKKIGKFLTAQRVPHRIRKKILIISDTEKIIWLWPIRIAEYAKITEKTRKILRLQITDSK